MLGRNANISHQPNSLTDLIRLRFYAFRMACGLEFASQKGSCTAVWPSWPRIIINMGTHARTNTHTYTCARVKQTHGGTESFKVRSRQTVTNVPVSGYNYLVSRRCKRMRKSNGTCTPGSANNKSSQPSRPTVSTAGRKMCLFGAIFGAEARNPNQEGSKSHNRAENGARMVRYCYWIFNAATVLKIRLLLPPAFINSITRRNARMCSSAS